MKRAGLVPVVFIGLVTFIGIAVAISGCATMTTGTSQSIAISSQPDGAECTLTRERQTIGKLRTPGSVTISRSTQAINVVCTKDGYEEARTVMNSLVESRTHLNALAGGLVGMMVDQASGASNRYEASAMLELTPLSPADQAAAAQAAARPKTQSFPSAVAATAQPTDPSRPPRSPKSPPGPYDGTYSGGVDLGLGNLRQIQVRVVSGKGKGTARYSLCPEPGLVTLVVDPSGAISGEADLVSGSACGSRKVAIEGHVDNKRLALTWASDDGTKPHEFSLTRRNRGIGVED